MYLHYIKLQGYTIYQQLQLEEALLRTDNRNWCIVQEGVPPAIVMGISGKPEQYINTHQLQQKPVPIVKRFSGGGTVFVDQHTLFVTFIFQADQIKISPCPDRVFCWSNNLYQQVFEGYPFSLRERDYVFGDLKFGGNAQYMRKDRWLHHSTFLWDYDDANMDYLLLPQKRPVYRQNRPHKDFLCRLSHHLSSKEHFWKKLESVLSKNHTLVEVKEIPNLTIPHRKSTTLI